MPNFLKPSPSEMTAKTERSMRTKIAARCVRVRREDGIADGGPKLRSGATKIPKERRLGSP